MSAEKIIATLHFAQGLQVSVQEAWSKIVARQFGGEPARGWVEILSNALDAYPEGTSWKDRWIALEVGPRRIATTDYGEGMSLERLRLLTTLGATDKFTQDKIGRFGVGFAAVMNPALGTRCVTVTTRCEGHTVEIVFHVVNGDRPPTFEARILDQPIRYSTRVEAEFRKPTSAGKCLAYAEAYLPYFPCRALVNRRHFETAWDRARRSGQTHFFCESNCDGFVAPTESGADVTVLCRYERIITLSVPHFIAERCSSGDLRDYYRDDFPYLPGVDATVNCNALDVTISRDGIMMDCAYTAVKRTLAKVLRRQLGRRLERRPPAELVLANQYILRQQLRAYLTSAQRGAAEDDPDAAVIQALARAKVYRLNGRRQRVSLEEIFDARSPDTPLFFAPRQTNLRWVGGAFRHDFIVLPQPCLAGGGAPDFYDTLLAAVFEDVVNLDTIAERHEQIRALVERGIVSKQALTPRCRLIGRRSLAAGEQQLARELDALLADPRIHSCITQTLHLATPAIRTAYFDVAGDGITIATGLFDEDGHALAPQAPEEDCTNLASRSEHREDDEGPVLLGLRRDHPLILFLIGSDNPDRAAYGLTAYVARELGLCQKRLVPFSRFYWTKVEELAANLRRVIARSLVEPDPETA